MPSINFRTARFNDSVDGAISNILDTIIAPFFSEHDLIHRLALVYSAFHDHCYDKLQAHEDADDLAKNIFSQFCQNLIYFTVHNIKNLATRYRIADILIADPFFIYRTSAGHVTTWVDPKEKATALIAACRGLTGNHVSAILQKAFQAFTNDPNEFERYINYTEKCGFTAFHAGVFDGNLDAINALLILAKSLSAHNIVNFESFLTIRSSLNFTPLQTAKKKGFIAIARQLAQYSPECCVNSIPPSSSDSPEGSPTEFFRNKKFKGETKRPSFEYRIS